MKKPRKHRNRKLVLHNLIEKDKGTDLYAAICLELNVASQGKTVKEAEANLREAVELYLEDVIAAGDEKDFIPRPADREFWLKFFKAQARKMGKALVEDLEGSLQFRSVVNA